jgi:hypothetical protein
VDKVTMVAMTRPRWTSVTIHVAGDNAVLDGPQRLGALCLWLRKEAPTHVTVRDPEGQPITDPMSVDWANFPLHDATTAALAVRPLLLQPGLRPPP